MRRKRLPPDTRPDWRDPQMPVVRNYKMIDGRRVEVVDPDYERRYRAHMIEGAPHPSWYNDPTYNMRKK